MSDEHNNKSLDALILEKSAEIVMAYVANNAIRAGDLHDLLSAVHSTLKGCASGEATVTAESPAELVPAVPVKKSINADYLVCLESGLKFKSLKRHLMSKYHLTPEAYRAKWGLPGDYPMTAPNYAKIRSEVAKAQGLGRKSETVSDASDGPEDASADLGPTRAEETPLDVSPVAEQQAA